MGATLRRYPLVGYFILAYGFTWMITVPLAASAQGWLPWSLPLPLHYLAQFGPMLAALVMTGITSGAAGLRELAGRVSPRRLRPVWWLIGISPIALFALAAVIARVIDGAWPALRQVGEINFLPYLGVLVVPLWLLTNGCGEEIGWRGYALPRLQQAHGAVSATLMLGVLWACWHLPYFFYLPNYRSMGMIGFPSFALGLLSGAVLLTWLFNSTGGSVLAVALWHGFFNVFTASAAGTGTVAAAMSTVVMVWAIALLIAAGVAHYSRSGKAISLGMATPLAQR